MSLYFYLAVFCFGCGLGAWNREKYRLSENLIAAGIILCLVAALV